MTSEGDFLLQGVVEPEEFVKESNAFLEKMKHKNAFELVKSIKEFVTYFFEGNYNADEQAKLVHQFTKSLMDRIVLHPLWVSDKYDNIEIGNEALERYLMHKLYQVTFCHPSTNNMASDERFYYQVRQLQFIQPHHLDIPDRPLNHLAFDLAAQEFAFLDHENYKAPREKLMCMLNVVIILTNLLRHYGDEESTGADDLFPYLIYAILRASPKQLHSNIRYIYRFRSRAKLKDEPAYYLMQVETAVAFIENVTHKELSISEEDFQCGVQECKERIESGKDEVQDFTLMGRQMCREKNVSILHTGTITPTSVRSFATATLPSDARTPPTSHHQYSHHLHHSHTSAHPLVDTSYVATGNSSYSPVKPQSDLIVTKYLNASLDQLTVAELRHLLQCYQNLSQHYLELKAELGEH